MDTMAPATRPPPTRKRLSPRKSAAIASRTKPSAINSRKLRTAPSLDSGNGPSDIESPSGQNPPSGYRSALDDYLPVAEIEGVGGPHYLARTLERTGFQT